MMRIGSSRLSQIEWRGVLPTVLLVGIVCVTQLSSDIGGLQVGMPLLGGITFFYWGLYRPDLVPFGVCLVVGLLQDVLSGVPLGLHAFGYVLLRQIASGQQQFLQGRAFHLVWVYFAFSFCMWSMIESFIMSVLGYPFGGAQMIQCLMTVLSFPLMYAFIGRFQHRYLRGH